MIQYHRYLVIGLIVGAFVALNVIMPSVFWESSPRDLMIYVGFFFVGGLVAEACLLSIWAALGSQTVAVRIPVTLGLLVLGVCSYLVGLRIQDNSLPTDVAIVMIGAATLLYCAMQVPLWVMRSRMRMRIDLREAGPLTPTQESAQFGLRHLLLWTTLISATLVLGKYCLPTGSLPRDTPWAEIALVLSVCAVFVILIGLPCIWVALGDRNRLPWMAWLILVGLLGPVIVLVSLSVMLGAPSEMAEILAALYSLGSGAACCLLATLFIMRGLGFHLKDPLAGSPLKAVAKPPLETEAVAPLQAPAGEE